MDVGSHSWLVLSYYRQDCLGRGTEPTLGVETEAGAVGLIMTLTYCMACVGTWNDWSNLTTSYTT